MLREVRDDANDIEEVSMRGFAVPSTLFAALLSAFALAGCGGGDDGGGDDGGGDGGGAAAGFVEITLAESMGSGQTGRATLTDAGGFTDVVIEVDGEPVSDSQPAHIHEGTCENLTPEPAFGLPNVDGGVSEATVEVPFADLLSGTYAINLHMSASDLETYTSCGNIQG
jgi:hypothetical protein